MSKHGTLNYLKDQYKRGNRIVVSRYGDGEYFILLGSKRKIIAGQEVTKDLVISLNESIKKKGQLICLPCKIPLNQDNFLFLEGKQKKLSYEITRYIISNSDHDLYGQVQWKDVDLFRYRSEFITEFFVGNTLIVTGHGETCERAFHDNNIVEVDVYKVPRRNAAGSYKKVKDDLVFVSKNYRNIVFGCGPIGKVLIADLIDECNSHLVDLGSSIGVVISPYSPNYYAVRSWPGFLRRADTRRIMKCSDDFFKTLNKKLDRLKRK